MVVHRILTSGWHYPELSAEIFWEIYRMNKPRNVRGRLLPYKVGGILYNSWFPLCVRKFCKGIQAGGFKVKIQKNNAMAAFNQNGSYISKCERPSHASFV